MRFTAGVPFVAIILGASAEWASYGSENDGVTKGGRPAGYAGAQSLSGPSRTPSPLPSQSSTSPEEEVDYNNHLVAINSMLGSPVINTGSSSSSDAQPSVPASSSTVPSAYWPGHASAPQASATANPLVGGHYLRQHYRHGKGESTIVAPVVASAASSFINYDPLAYNSVPSPACDADAPNSSPVSPITATSSEPAIASSYVPVSSAASSIEIEPEVASSASSRAYGGYIRRGYGEGIVSSSTISSSAAPSSAVADPTFRGRYQAPRPTTRVRATRITLTTITRARTSSTPAAYSSTLAASTSSSVLVSPFRPVKGYNGVYGRHAPESQGLSASYIVGGAPSRTRGNAKPTGSFGLPNAQTPGRGNNGSGRKGSEDELETEADTQSGASQGW